MIKRPSRRRLELLLALVVGLACNPLAAQAQQPTKVYRIGFLSSSLPPEGLPALRQGLRELGYDEGRNILIEHRFAELKLDRLSELANELVRLKVDLIVTVTTPAALAAKQATNTIPIVMATGGDPVGSGLVASLARPGGNVTGLTHLAGLETWEKVLDLLKEIAPSVSRVAVFRNSAIPPEARGFELLQGPARARGLSLLPIEVRVADGFAAAFATAISENADAIAAFESPLNRQNRKTIAQYAIQKRLPTAFGHSVCVEAGGLISNGVSFDSLFQRAATYVDKILKGAKPSVLPVEQPSRFEVVLNVTTAKALGLRVPPTVLLRVDRIIE